jgi:hypothetical protein
LVSLSLFVYLFTTSDEWIFTADARAADREEHKALCPPSEHSRRQLVPLRSEPHPPEAICARLARPVSHHGRTHSAFALNGRFRLGLLCFEHLFVHIHTSPWISHTQPQMSRCVIAVPLLSLLSYGSFSDPALPRKGAARGFPALVQLPRETIAK